MKKSILLLATAASFAALPAQAATFVGVGDSATVNFNGTEPGTFASLMLTLVGEAQATAVYTFDYVLTNLSVAPSTQSRVTTIGFNDTTANALTGPGGGSLTTVNVVDNGINNIVTDRNFPNGLGNREVCLTSTAACAGGGGGGATLGDPATGRFTLDYAGSLSQLTLTDFVVRYQSTGDRGEGSGTGIGTEVPAVPEPATWAMLLLGFGAIGYAMRRRKEQGGLATSRVGFAF